MFVIHLSSPRCVVKFGCNQCMSKQKTRNCFANLKRNVYVFINIRSILTNVHKHFIETVYSFVTTKAYFDFLGNTAFYYILFLLNLLIVLKKHSLPNIHWIKLMYIRPFLIWRSWLILLAFVTYLCKRLKSKISLAYFQCNVH